MSKKLEFINIENKDFINQYFYRYKILENEFENFKNILINYIKDMNKREYENEDSLVANCLSPFFKKFDFETHVKYKMKGKSEIDLAILKDSDIQVIIEAKKPNDKDFFYAENPNCKALHEAILYYFRIREESNSSIKYIILTDFYKFYIFEAKEFENGFYKNKDFEKLYKSFTNKNSIFDGRTEEFYLEAKKILDLKNFALKGAFIDLNEIIKTDAEYDFKSLKPYFKIFNRDFLLQEFNPNDANQLNKGFYDELLYLLGLCEKVINGKTLIAPSKNSIDKEGTLYYNILQHLPEYKRDKKENSENEIDENALEILIIWINRILFLKLLESSLINFNDDKNLAFLNIDKIQNYNKLNELFFKILAKKPNDNDRKQNNIKDLTYLPYLNSSLFTRSNKEIIEISQLSNLKLEYFKNTQIKDKSGKAKKGKEDWLKMIFEFLNSFDFGANYDNENLLAQKDLINSSVLGLVFEKLNGYKEGSFYTPSFITNYMCNQSLEKIVIEKFNNSLSWECKTIDDIQISLDRFITNKESFNKAIKIFNEIRICDPAVGSGHFLVSALNELLLIKYNLGLLIDEDGWRLKDIKLELKNDEIVIRDSENNIHNYKRPKHENTDSHKIQRTIFFAKKEIIENNLFGVDINPNSCEITKLRLWIELLKYSYYRDIENKYLETLPNIDINIKCGNSIISRFDLKDSLKNIPKIDKLIKDYKCLVAKYKNADGENSKHSKREIEIKINEIKENLTLNLKSPKTINSLEKEIQAHIDKYGMYLIDDKNLLSGLTYTKNLLEIEELNETEKEEAFESYGRIQILRKKLDSVLSGKEYKNAFEWRLEFPEVLNENGDFIGFDLVIGNPPYIDYREIDENTINKTKNYAVNENSNRPNIFCYFIEKGIEVANNNGILTFINPIAMLQSDFAYGTRKLLLEKGCINYIVDCSYIKVFASASTYPTIYEFKKNKKPGSIKIVLWKNDNFKHSHNIETYSKNEQLSINISKHKINFQKVDCRKLGEIGLLKWGTSQSGYGKKKILLSDFKKLNKSKRKEYNPIIQTADIKRYCIVWQKEYIPTEIYSQNIQKDFKKPKIVIARMTKNIQASFDKNKFYMGKSTLIVDLKENPYYILGILNSKLADFWYKYYFGATHLACGYVRYDIPYLKQLPIPKINSKNKKITDRIIRLVDRIIKAKEKNFNANTSKLELEIYNLVYELYCLLKDEIRIIE